MARLVSLWALFVLALSARSAEPAPTFEDHVRPILKAYCFECHGESDSPKGGLDLRLKRLAEKGGKHGPSIVAGKPAASLLLARVRNGEMPPSKKKLTPSEMDAIEKWIAAGAVARDPEPEALAAGFTITTEDRAWWAFQPIRRPAVPPLTDVRIRQPIDAFILQKMRAKRLDFSADADPTALIRRVNFDLTGLPPTPAEVDVFLKEYRERPDAAYERLIDRLLTSPAYGERWGRHWLDVAGYADSEGYSSDDPVRNNAWRYRDYVIRAFNADKPFNEFIVEQLAGDELVRPPYANLTPDQIEKLTATGFLRMAPDGTATGGMNTPAARNQVVSDTIRIVSSSFLGLTMGCAECHNHRYDPIPQSDFYRLRAVIEPAYDVKNWRVPAARQVSLYTDADRQKAKEIEAEAARIDAERSKKDKEFIEAVFQKELAKLPEAIREQARTARNTPDAKRTPEQKKLMQEHPSLNVSSGSLYLYDPKAADVLKKMADDAAKVRAGKPVEDFLRVMNETPGVLPTTHLYHRGDPDQPRQAVAPGGLTILDDMIPMKIDRPKDLPSSGRRLALARWLTDRNQPLTARVLVNRVWQGHFGRGIVGTPGDFGRLGERPTHPELLDWLAAEFMENGWSLKKLHRTILLSTTYRQSSRTTETGQAVDPDNRMLHRQNLRRLDAESVRDAMLAISGKLNPKAFGPPVPVRENEVGQIVVGKGTKDLARGSVAVEPLPENEIHRRSIYVQVRRSMPVGVLETFDAAATEPNCERRTSATATPQSLLLLNSDLIVDQSRFLAERIRREAGEKREAQVVLGWRLVYHADPSASDIRRAAAFIESQEALFKSQPAPKAEPKGKQPPLIDPETRALSLYAQALLISNRFLYLE